MNSFQINRVGKKGCHFGCDTVDLDHVVSHNDFELPIKLLLLDEKRQQQRQRGNSFKEKVRKGEETVANSTKTKMKIHLFLVKISRDEARMWEGGDRELR